MANQKKKKNTKSQKKTNVKATAAKPPERPNKMPRKEYEAELRELQAELCHLQEYVKKEGLRVIVLFEGRDAAGKGGVIKRISERVSPRVFRTVALPAPNDRQASQWFFQRYIEHFPAAGEIVLFDRSWYNRAGVEHVMGFCTPREYEDFLRVCPGFERDLIDSGIKLIKYFFDVSQEEQERRFDKRATDPMRTWKLSPMDVESWRHWWDYTAAYHRMLEATDNDHSPWYRVEANDKRRARLNSIGHLLNQIPYKRVKWKAPDMGTQKKRKPGAPVNLKFKHEVPEIY